MRTTTRVVCLVMATALLLALTMVPVGSAGAAKKAPAQNVIVMIADGWGFNHLTSESYYMYGKDGRQVFERFPFEFAMSTYMAYEEGDACFGHGYDPAAAWSDFGYAMTCATDSAAAATAMSTGHKALDGVIGLDVGGTAVMHALERAEELGKATGTVTSVQLSHATPAGFVAHNVSRNNYEDIAKEMVYDSHIDVVMGAGHPWFDNDGLPKVTPNTFKYVGGSDTWDDLLVGINGWTLIEERAEFQALATGPTPDRVFGVAQVYWTLQQSRDMENYLADPFTVPFTDTVPTLEEMTKAALNVLDDDPDGLFLMIEGGAIDWASHGNYDPNSSGRVIEEFVDFERSVEAVMDWVKANSNWGETLLIVTGDHETGYLNGPGSDPFWEPIVNYGAGSVPGMEWHSPDHTNSLIPMFAKGDAGRMFRGYADGYDPVHGKYLDNTELAEVLFRAMG